MALSVPCEMQAQFKHKAYLFLANIWIFTIFIGWTLLFLPVGYAILILSKLCPSLNSAHLMRLYIHTYGRITWILLRPFIPVNVHNTSESSKFAPAIFIVNHQSFLDLFLFGAQHSPNVVFISKSWPYKTLFFFAPMMRCAEYIDVEKNTPQEIEVKCQELIKKNVSIVIFPEGQRTRNGQLGRFHAGAFQMAYNLNVPIVPFVIRNSAEVFPVGAKYFVPNSIDLSMLKPILPNNFADEDLPHRVMMRAAKMEYVQYFNKFNGGL